MSRGARVRERLYLVTRLAFPSERAKDERRASLVVQAESATLAALACARFLGPRAAPFRFDVEPHGTGIDALYDVRREHPTFRPQEAEWRITRVSTGDAEVFKD